MRAEAREKLAPLKSRASWEPIAGGKDLVVRVSLSRETIVDLVTGKRMVLCFQLDFGEEDEADRRDSEGSSCSSSSFEFPVLGGSSQEVCNGPIFHYLNFPKTSLLLNGLS